ncbi:MAG: arginine--tRNA ligase [Patescibacteria group bacterium]|nr:arginine--tRNA ligase [Patescibacteria group bacterium]
MLNKEIKRIINRAAGDLYQDMEIPGFVVEYPQDKKFGDYASNIAMVLAGKLNKNPLEVAEEIKDKIRAICKNGESSLRSSAERLQRGNGTSDKSNEPENLFAEITIAKPGFINFRISDKYLRKNLCKILKGKCKFGSSDLGKDKTVLIDYSAPNIAKPMHIGHLRSTIIGQSLYNIYEFLGYKVISDNHLGDWGTQFGKLIYAYKNWGDKKKISKNPIEEMTKLYVQFHKEAKSRKSLEEFAREETKRLQNKNSENIKIWKFLVKKSLKDFKKIYKTLNIKFDYTLGESFYDNLLAGIVKEGLDKKIAFQSEGAIVVNLDQYNLTPLLIKKSDGAYLYATTDLAAIKYRKEKFNPNEILYIVANEQEFYLQQLFASAELFGLNGEIEMKHIKFGMVLGETGKKFSTRKGETVKLKEVISKSIKFSQEIIEEKNPKLSKKEKKKIAKVVGLGAIKYNDLSQNRLTDIVFNWDKMLSFDGNSAPYLQYTCARIKSLKRKYNKLYKLDRVNIFDNPNFKLLEKGIEKDIMRQLIKFPEMVENAARENSPHLIASYIYEIASLYNNFYNSAPILKTDKKLAKARIYLSKSVMITIGNGLSLLGIETLERM